MSELTKLARKFAEQGSAHITQWPLTTSVHIEGLCDLIESHQAEIERLRELVSDLALAPDYKPVRMDALQRRAAEILLSQQESDHE